MEHTLPLPTRNLQMISVGEKLIMLNSRGPEKGNKNLTIATKTHKERIVA